MSSLVPSFKETIYSSCSDVVPDYAELAIDAILNDPVLEKLPIVSTLSAVCKLGYNLRERNLMKQTISFIKEFNNKSISPDALERHRQLLDNDPAKEERELERVLVILDQHFEQLQSRYLGSFYAAYVNGSITWETFCELSEANRRIFVKDYPLLSEAALHGGLNTQGNASYQVDRLVSLGLLRNETRLSGSVWINMDGSEEPSEKKNDVLITSFGQTFSQYAPTIAFDSSSIF